MIIHIIGNKDMFEFLKEHVSPFGTPIHYETPPEDTIEAFIISHIKFAGETGADVWVVWEDEKVPDTDIDYIILPKDLEILLSSIKKVMENGDALMLSPSLLEGLDEQDSNHNHFTIGGNDSPIEEPEPTKIDQSINQNDDNNTLNYGNELTSPGFKFQNQQDNQKSLTEAQSISYGQVSEYEISPQDYDVQVDPGRKLWELHLKKFNGYTKITDNSPLKNPAKLWWKNGFPIGLEGGGNILSSLLFSKNFYFNNLHLLQHSKDPITLALKHHLILEQEVLFWQQRLIIEVLVKMCAQETAPESIPTYEITPSYEISPQDGFEPLLIRAIVEGYSGVRAFALLDNPDAAPIDFYSSVDSQRLKRILHSKHMDPLWVLVINQMSEWDSWKESVLWAGLNEAEGCSLLYALRLMEILEPPVPQYPTKKEIFRLRVMNLSEIVEKQDTKTLLGNNRITARRRYKDIMLMLDNIPKDLAFMLSKEINKIKISLNKTLESI